MAKDHFVPRHYLRCFTINGSEEIMMARLSPFLEFRKKGIGGQCQKADFYEGDARLAEILWTCENDLAPVLVRVVETEAYTEPELVALKWLVVSLHTRTKKATEAYKVFPKKIAMEFTQHAIESGQLPPPPGGTLTEDMLDFKGVPGLLAESVIPCVLEMQTLACKFLKAPDDGFFVTSDHPVALLNQFCVSVEPHRSYAGFSKAGFQLLLPISPKLCLFFYDPKIYKVGSLRQRLVPISTEDVDIVNALQIQSADECLYFHDAACKNDVQALVGRYSGFRGHVRDAIQTITDAESGNQLIHFRRVSARLPKPWQFCREKRRVSLRIGDRRNPPWSALIDELMQDFKKHPNNGNMFDRISKILADPNSLRNVRLR